jgi:thiamine biosynthesis protein ThiI
MPTDPRQQVVALLSGGYDSPVAAFLMMKRGCRVVMVHFQNYLQNVGGMASKMRRLGEQLARYQAETQLYIVPFADIQKEIIKQVPAAFRMLIYRRFMIRIAAEFADKLKAPFLVVGDSLSQVASQTLQNLEATYSNSRKQILTPLIGLDKKEIIDIARAIGTFEISAIPYGDCCSYFVPRHPELRASSAELDRLESDFDMKSLISRAVSESETFHWD